MDFSYASKAPVPILGSCSRSDPSNACERPAAIAARVAEMVSRAHAVVEMFCRVRVGAGVGA
eukprot:4796726-Pleurochrysis_carterae.AAC.1